MKAVLTADGPVVCDGVIASADYQFVEQQLLPADKRNYSAACWNKKVMAPSCLIYYLGVDGTIDRLKHHNLFFDESFDDFAGSDLYQSEVAGKSLFYTCIPTKTDASVAPDGKENLFILIPVAPGLEDTDEIRSRYFEKAMDKLEKHAGQQIRHRVEVQHSFAYRDFVDRYHSFRRKRLWACQYPDADSSIQAEDA